MPQAVAMRPGDTLPVPCALNSFSAVARILACVSFVPMLQHRPPYLTELLIRLNGLRLQLQEISDGTQWLGRSFGPAMRIENYKIGIESPCALAPEQADAAR